MTQQLKFKVFVKWNGADYSDESARLVNLSLSTSVMDVFREPFPKSGVTTGTLTLDNTDWRFTPRSGLTIAQSIIHTYIDNFPANGFEMYIQLDEDGEEPYDWNVFTGRIIGYSHNETANTVTFTVAQITWVYLQREDYSEVFSNLSISDLIDEYATIGEITSTTISPSPIRMRYAWLGGDNALTDAQYIADASLSYLYPSPSGSTVFDTYDTWYSNTAGTVSFTPDANYRDMQTNNSTSSKFTDVIIEYSPRDLSGQEKLYTLDERIFCPADVAGVGSVQATHILKTTKPIFAYTEPIEDVDYGITLGSGRDATGYASISVTVYAQEIHVTITNSHPSLEAILEWFTLNGIYITGSASKKVVKNIESISGFKRTRNYTPRFYTQTDAHGDWLADVFAQRLAIKNIGVQILDIPVTADLMNNAYEVMNMGTAVKYQRYNDTEVIDGHVVECLLKYNGEGIFVDIGVVNRKVLYPEDNYVVLSTTGTLTDSQKVFC